MKTTLLTLTALALAASCNKPSNSPPTTEVAEPGMPAAETQAPAAAAPTAAAPQGEHEGHGSHDGQPQPRPLADGSQAFGGDIDAAAETVTLASILASPDQFAGKTVKTQGEITQVCQRMGCWMELRGEPNTPAIRVPMAGHGFFLPRDVAGRRATVQGAVEVRELSEDDARHLEEEGAQAARQRVGIQATAVVVHPAA
jgi:hypothetical protein